jgi:heat shock protein HslJ
MIGLALGLRVVLSALVMGATGAALSQESEFPFDGELILDVKPMPGSKRIPNMDIDAGGKIDLELWCNRVEGQVVVAGDTITIMTGQPTDRPCSPERAQADADLLATLHDITNWRRQGDVLLLIGPKPLRFRAPTN